MTTNRDNQQRAADFLRQWQQEMTKQMTNPDSIRAMLDAMQHFGKGDPTHDANARRPTHAPDARDDAIRDLAQRLVAVERQLAKLHERVLSLDAKAQKPARAGKRASAEPVVKRQRAMAKPQPGNAQRQSVAKRAGRKILAAKRK